MTSSRLTKHPDYLEAPRRRARDDFWGQVKRTVNGRSVSEDEIELIVSAIRRGLDLDGSDVLLDLACGNGALSARLFDGCRAFVGVDYSDYLVSVAEEFFADPPERRFICQDVATYVRTEPEPTRFTKVLCYGSFAYFSDHDARVMLSVLAERFPAVRRVMLGNLPDRSRVDRFYGESTPAPEILADPLSSIGVWRTGDELTRMAGDCGWSVSFRRMPAGFYAAHYRHDAVLTRL